MAVVATHVFVAVAPPPEGATPADTISSPLISATAVAPALLGTAPVLQSRVMEGFQRGRAQSWHEPRFYLRRFIGGFFTWGVPISWHVPRFYLLILADVVRFPSAFGPW